MANKEFVVFGLGRFGKSVATTLADSGCEVLVVDDNEDKIQEMADIVTYAVKANVTDVDTMETLGISNFDGAIVAIGEDLEASVMVTILAKELGIPYVLAKAQNDLHAKILKKVGADMVVFPEKETGIRIANNLLLGNFFDAVELSSTFSMMEVEALKEWDGHSLRELNLRAKYKVNVIGIKKNGVLDINPDADIAVSKNDVLVMIGKNETLNKLASMQGK
ncbi:potassium channel family protein [Anaerosporobacter faecicola]|uniref:potassium channel family protein n=1 Tax=Anaerosporobacter faecicola TaxID=2718714 RepID=UPI00143BA75C|nr:TrkA family potassium uptake protein [Anaerosporobacter faecicola]